MTKDNNGKTFSLPNVKELEPYCDLMKKREISEIEIETDQIRVRLVTGGNLNNNPQKQVLNVVNHDDISSVKTNVIEKEMPKSNIDLSGSVNSPMVGTAYLSPEPKAKQFIKKGDKVSKGQTLLIIEAMKVMNSISSPRDGVIQDILIEDSQPVEYDQPLVLIK
jgi:acetyl-CoA carboxylase biotin carboxyl carrier protein